CPLRSAADWWCPARGATSRRYSAAPWALSRAPTGRPLCRTPPTTGKENEMSLTTSVIESAYEQHPVDERPVGPRKAIDPDAALLGQLRGREPEATEALIDAYGDRVFR